MSRVAALLVTHNGQQWIGETIDSVVAQSRQPDAIVIVDDHSTDDTIELIQQRCDGRASVHVARSIAHEPITRIAQNFEQGLLACAGYDIVVLGDHDDVWRPHRIAHQAAILEADARLAMVASDGHLLNGSGVRVCGSLRGTFDVPRDFNVVSPSDRMRMALRHLIATGGASALRPQAYGGLTIPDGWLHDRWWSLVATALEAMVVDDTVVIDYRLSSGQQVGLDPGSTKRSAASRVLSAGRRFGPSMRKLADIRRELAPVATPRTGPELRGVRLVRNLL